MSTVVIGLFDSPQAAAAAVHSLEARGLDSDRISIIADEAFNQEAFEVDSHTKLPEGVAIGAGAGGAVGALVAGLTAVGTIASGGAGILVAGPLVAALAGAGAGAAGGSIIGGLVGLAIPEHELKHYEKEVRQGGVLVGAECRAGDDPELVERTFKECGAKRVSRG